MSAALRVFSGACCLCDVGRPANAASATGEPLHTGDIVMISQGSYLDTDLEQWSVEDHLTVVVANQYQSFHGGETVLLNADAPAFVMGLKSVGFENPAWRIRLVKSHTDVIDGEHWKAYGFSFKATGSAA